MKFLITGGAGFIGSHLSERLLSLNHDVTIIDNLSTGSFNNIEHLSDHPRFHFAIDTITNELVMDRLVSECDVIFHLAAAVGVDLIVKNPINVIETNILGTDILLNVTQRYRKKVLIASSSEIYGKSNYSPFNEESDRLLGPTTKSRWCYSASKAVDEFLGLAYYSQKNLPVVIFRLFNTVGPRQTGQYGMVIPRFVKQALEGKALTVYGDGKQSRCFCNVEDSVRAIIGLAESNDAIGQVFNIGSTQEITILDLAHRVLKIVDEQTNIMTQGTENKVTLQNNAKEERIVFIPYDQAYEKGFEDMRHRKPDIKKIKDFIGWEPKIGLDETLQQVVASMK